MVKRRKFTSPLIYWAVERENIRLAKEARQPAPWTTDPILQKYRFCCVRRCDDRVSQWLINHVYKHQSKYKDTLTFIKVVALCRWCNWPPTLRELQEEGLWDHNHIDLVAIGHVLDERVKSGTKSYTGAYMVRAPSKKKYPGVGKGKFVAETVVGALDTVRQPLQLALVANQAKLAWETICSVSNFGSFMSGQIVADLTYTPLLDQAYDLNTWAPQGPGSRRGFNRLLGRPLKAKIEDEEWSYWLQEWRGQVADAIGSELNLHDTQNICCEIDKYLRVKNGEGRPRSTYRSETAF